MRAYKVELDPTKMQISEFVKYADVARWTWNFAVGRSQEVREWNRLPLVHMKYPNAMVLAKEVVRLKHTTCPWLSEMSKCVSQETLRDFDRAVKRVFDAGFGFPKFKSKKWAKKSFTLTSIIPKKPQIVIEASRIKLPTLGWIRLKEHDYIPTEGVKIFSATVSETAGRWFVSVQVDDHIEPIPVPINAPIIGVDQGIKADNMLVLSTGKIYTSPRALRTNERKLKRLQRSKDRKQKGSNNRAKALLKIARQHFKITNIRKDALHKATTEMAKAQAIYVVQTQAVRAMMSNHHLAKSIADAGMSEVVRQLEYKVTWYGSKIIKADQYYPSSQLCSNCGRKHSEMKDLRSDLRCDCGLVIDRDLNAAINLSRWPMVCRTLETPVENVERSLKQEPSLYNGGI